MGKLLPIILLVIGGAVGGGAGILLKPEPEIMCDETDADAESCKSETSETEDVEMEEPEEELDYVAMKNQFVVPVIQDELVRSLVVMSLSLETTPDNTSMLFSKEPKLRDAFLRVLFDHSHIGGFNGAFTESGRLSILRVALLEAARSVAGKAVLDVLITDVARQEM